MKGVFKFSSEWILVLLIIVLVQQISIVSAVYSMDQTCAQYSTGWIADPNDCTSFGYCNNSVFQGTARCPKGYVFNARRAECQAPTADSCTVGNVCLYAADKSFVANPSDCSSYYYCERKAGKLVYCPSGQIFDSRSTTCIWKPRNRNNVCAANSICRLVPDGQFIGDPDFCGQFIACINGVGTPGKCPDNTYFNKQLGGCQPTNPCQGRTPVGLGLGVATGLPDNPSVCKNVVGTKDSYFADGKTCMGYYYCKDKNGPGSWRKCPPNLHFEDGQCRSPCSVKCEFDRCGNMNQAFMGAYGQGCTNYLVCQNQTSQATNYKNYVGTPCPDPNNPFFDEVLMTCVATSPGSDKYLLCPKVA